MSLPTIHSFDFDPTYGLDVAELRAIEPLPATSRFDAFWQARYAGALGVRPHPRLTPSSSTHPDWHVDDIAYTPTGGFVIGGWLLWPRQGPVRRGLVVGQGYGGREQPDFNVPVQETAVLFSWLSRSSRPPMSSDPAWHVLHDIDKPERYILGGRVEDLWLAVSVLIDLHPDLDERIGYGGVSFGGGIGALAIAFDHRIDRGHFVVPTFCNMPLWLTLPTTGSGRSAQHHPMTHLDVLDTLSLFDAATAATQIAQPMLVAVARFDPAVAPPCQFCVANALSTSNDHQTVILDAGHFDYPESAVQHALLTDRARRFFGAT